MTLELHLSAAVNGLIVANCKWVWEIIQRYQRFFEVSDLKYVATCSGADFSVELKAMVQQ